LVVIGPRHADLFTILETFPSDERVACPYGIGSPKRSLLPSGSVT
jgi:hypothetical protein